MPEQLSPSLVELREKIATFIVDELEPLESQLTGLEVDPVVRTEVIKRSRAAGLFGLTQPTEFGGGEAGPLALTVVREALGRANLRVGAYVLGPRPGVLVSATGRLRDNYLEPLMRGEKRAAFAFTEPEDVERRTWAAQDGDELVITGRKAFVTRGADADFISALVNVERDAQGVGGTAMIVVDR
ncbi:MAG: acyl-CoA/acyl-ACP dehydrogenase, partial [Gammaproteobacteria bacterium]|nr:acyl-CoA/acyl-ACP dehydrogenase [Gammaproteobacteria bacterium]